MKTKMNGLKDEASGLHNSLGKNLWNAQLIKIRKKLNKERNSRS